MTLKMKNALDDAKAKYFNILEQDDIKPEEFSNAQTEYFEAIAEDASKKVKEEFQAFKKSVSNDDILARRGMNALTAEERTFYNEVIRSEGFEDDLILPETVIDRVFEDLQEEHPLLAKIRFVPTTAKTKVIRSRKSGVAVWGPLHKDLEGQLDVAFDQEEFTQLALTAFVILSNDTLDLGPAWLDRYVRICLSEAISDAWEVALIEGTGNNEPIGLLKDMRGGTNGAGELSDKASKGTLTFADAPTMVAEFAGVLKGLSEYTKYIGANDTEGEVKQRKVDGKVNLIVNPVNYYDIVARATVQNVNGAFITNLPFIGAENIIESVHVPADKLIAFVEGQYDATVSRPEKIHEYKETFAMQRSTLYAVDMLSNGQPVNNDAAHVYDIAIPVDGEVEGA